MDARRGLAQSRGAMLLIGGEAGAGKSRLLDQFLATSARDSRPRLQARVECFEHSELPFGPFRRLLAVLGAAFPKTPQHDRSESFAAIEATLRDLADKRATIVAIEDLHWADSSSLELFAYLAPRITGKRLLILGTFRDERAAATETPFGAMLGRLVREPNVTRIDLEPLDAPLMGEILDGALRGQRSLDSDVREEIIRRSDGNPFFAEELLKSALERGDHEEPSLPRSIRAVIAGRLELLSAEDRRILATAAVLGYRFDPELVARILGCPIDDVLPVLRRGRDQNVIVEEDDTRGRFRFRHALTHQAVYEAMLRYDARRMHARILTTLESYGEEDRYIDALAYHAWEARDADRAIRYNERAGQAALALRSLPEARDCFLRALEIAKEPLVRANLLAELAFVYEMQGALSESVDRFSSALAIFKSLANYDRATEMVRHIATNRNNLDDVGSLPFAIAFLEEFGDRVGVEQRDMLLAALARLASIQQKRDLQAGFIARIEAPNQLPPRAKQNYLIARMDAHFVAGDITAWAAIVDELFETVELVEPFIASIALYSIAQTSSFLGRREIADRALDRAATIERRWDFGALRIFGCAIRAQRAWLWGDLTAARTYASDALAGSQATVARLALALSAPYIAIALGEPSLVNVDMEADVAKIRSAPKTVDHALILAGAASLGFAQGRVVVPMSDVSHAFALLDVVRPGSGPLIALAAEHLDGAAIARLRALLSSDPLHTDHPVRHADGSLARAILERRFGDEEVAVALARDAATTYAAIGWRLFEARAREVAGEADAARAIYEACGATALARGPGSPAQVTFGSLSERETAIALMIADGATNAAIGQALAVGTKTVEKHVTSIFRKLGVSKRAQIAVHIARER